MRHRKPCLHWEKQSDQAAKAANRPPVNPAVLRIKLSGGGVIGGSAGSGDSGGDGDGGGDGGCEGCGAMGGGN